MPKVTERADHVLNLSQNSFVLLLYFGNLCLDALACLLDVRVDGL